MRLVLCALATLCALAASMPAHARPLHDVTGLDQANQVAGEHGQQGRDNAAFHQATQTTGPAAVPVPEPTSTAPITVLDNGPVLTNDITKHNDSLDLTGLDQANQVAGEHGQQGRDNAAFHLATGSAQNGSFTTLNGPTTVPSSVPEPTSLVLLSSGLVGLWFMRLRKS